MTIHEALAALNIESVRWWRYDLGFASPMRTAQTTLHRRTGLLVRIVDHHQHFGWGEAAPLPGFSDHNLATAVTAALRSVDGAAAEGPSSVIGALESARVDLAARSAGVSSAELLGGGQRCPSVPANALIGGASSELVGAAVSGALDGGYRTLKLKVGRQPWSVERDVVRAASEAAAMSAAKVRLDANGGWDIETARTALAACDAWGIELVEDPVADPVGCHQLGGEFSTPVALDTAITDLAAVEQLLALDGIRVVVIKPAVCGGPIAARKIIERVEQAGRQWFVTSFLDSAVGRAVAAHVAAAGSGPPLACGLATGSLLVEDVVPSDVAADITLHGMQSVSDGPGWGIEPDIARLSPL